MIRAVFVFFLLLLSGCHTATPSVKKQLRLVIQEDPATLDPRLAADALSSHLLLLMFEGLVKLHPDGSITPAQCSSFSLSQDKTTYTFTLGKALWSDGSPVTAHDFARTWKEILSPNFAAPNAHLFYPIKNAELVKKGMLSMEHVGIQAPNENTLIVHLERPTPYFLELISFCAFSPYKKSPSPISNGPFTLTNWSAQRELLFTKNIHYLNAQDIHLDSVHCSVIDNEITAVAMYNKGEIDLLGEPFSKVSPDTLPLIPQEDILSVPVCSTIIISFDTTKFPFSNPTLRKAFSLAIDREEILQNIMNKGDLAAFDLIHPNLKKETTIKTILEHQTTSGEAQALFTQALSELGMTAKELEPHLVYLYSGSLLHKNMAQALQQQWAKTLNVRISLQNVDNKMLLASLGQKHYAFAQTTCRAQYFDPLSILERFQHKESVKNYPSWENGHYQQLLQSSFFVQGEKRAAVLEDAEKLLLAETPVIPLFHLSLYYAKKPTICNIELSPSGGIFFERLSLNN